MGYAGGEGRTVGYAGGEGVFSFEGPGLDCQMGMLFHPLILNYVFHLKLVDPD